MNNTESELSFFDSYMRSPLGTRIAGILFVIAKVCGLMALPLAFGGYSKIGMSLLILAASSCFISIFLCIRDMNKQSKTEEKQFITEDEILERLLKEGRLNQRIKEIKART